MTTTVNTHQPVLDGGAVKCADPECHAMTVGLIPLGRETDTDVQDRARNYFTKDHTAQYEPGRAPNIEVDWQVVATCSVCPDGGDVDTEDCETLRCSECGTTWSIDGNMGERAEAGQ